MRKNIAFTGFFVAILALSACQTAPKEESKNQSNTAVDTFRQTRDGFSDAATAPFEDLNLKRDKIPESIAGYVSPYDPVRDMSCETIDRAVRQLDTVLDPDIDVQIKMAQDGLEDKKSNSDHASDFALGQIASEARSLIPFRGLVREVTGANSHQKKVDKAYQIAYLRRSYLKGIGYGRGCVYPAAPLPIDYSTLGAPEAPIAYKAGQPHDDRPQDLIQQPVGSSVD